MIGRVPQYRKALVGPLKAKRCSCARRAAMPPSFTDQKFGPYTISGREQICRSDLSFAFVNLKPIVEGHVLISPQRVVPRFLELTSREVEDLWGLAQRVGKVMEDHLRTSALTFAIQDGAAAGQSVPHVHVHCLPRKEGDFARNDEIYDQLEDPSNAQGRRGEKLVMDDERKPRSHEEMAGEAAEFRSWFYPPK